MDIDNVSSMTPLVATTAGGVFSSQATADKPVSGTEIAATQATRPAGQEQGTPGAQQLRDAVSRINEYVQAEQRSIRFSVDEITGRDVVTVLDRETEEVIRQIPLEEVLVFARNLAEQNAEDLSLFNGLA